MTIRTDCRSETEVRGQEQAEEHIHGICLKTGPPRRVGVELGRGRKLPDIVGEMREVAEGVKTTRSIYELGRRLRIEMPITASIYALLYEDKPALEAANELMGRPLKRE